jgi:2-polyprenyl-3-methyl-5-hydroxy-6-metoxy-1,4-benzoquinol methylase
MSKLLSNILHKPYEESVQLCKESVLNLTSINHNAILLDCGCDDGSFTTEIAKIIGTKQIYGIEISNASAKAQAIGIKTKSSDLNNRLPYEDNTFDVIIANQLIEHLSDTDGFVQEIKRTLKPNGYAIISTNNLSSWHNIGALLIGRQPFPSDVSNYTHIGKLVKMWGDGDAGSWSHLRVFTMHALVKFFEHHGFVVEKNIGVGYYPFSGLLSKFLSKIDKYHTAYVTIKVLKR